MRSPRRWWRRRPAVGDPVWRLPLWPGYDGKLDSPVADMDNVWEAPFAGSITAALFLKRFAKHAQRFAHFDLYGWRPAANALGPRRRAADGARRVHRSRQGALPDERVRTRHAKTRKRAGAPLDPRRNAFRADLAAKSLYGKVSAPHYVQGSRHRCARRPCRCAAGRPRAGLRDGSAVRRDAHRLTTSATAGRGCS